jgi:hypothetical protein
MDRHQRCLEVAWTRYRAGESFREAFADAWRRSAHR